MFDFSYEYAMRYQYDVRQTRWGVYGPCKCNRPGYDRSNPENCRWCKKPFRGVYLERNKSGVTFEQVEAEYQESVRQQAEAERLELERIRKESGDDEFKWLRSLSLDRDESSSSG